MKQLTSRARALTSRVVRNGQPDLASVVQMRSSLERLRTSGVTIDRVVDVGACMGEWTELVTQVFSRCEVMMVEPLQRHAPALQKLAERRASPTYLATVLVGPEQRESVDFYETDDRVGTGSSMYEELSDVRRHVEKVEMTTLADVLGQVEFGSPDLIKLDVQGFELEVLRGFEEDLGSVGFLLIELATMPYNHGAPLFAEVVQWLDERGFVVHDIAGETRYQDQLVQLDLLFANIAHPVRRQRSFSF